LLLEGKGIEKDEVTAYSWFKKASDLGHFGAKNEYANALIEGKFVEQDVKSAVQLFQQTAAAGNPVGLFSLGQAFAAGLGVDLSLIKSLSYFNVASALQHPNAAAAREALEKQMIAADVLKAQQLAKAWRPNAKVKTE
jgi:TPR repeat protein